MCSHCMGSICFSFVISKSWHTNDALFLTVVSALSVSFFRERSLCFFPPAARTLTRVSPPINPRQLGAPQKHFWASLLLDRGKKVWYYDKYFKSSFILRFTLKEVVELFLPISLKLIIKSEFRPSGYSFSSEEADSELAINSPLQRAQ